MNIFRQYVPSNWIIVVIVIFILQSTVADLSQAQFSRPDYSTTNNCCNDTTGESYRVEVEFETTVVQKEYIVRFDGYYLSRTREKYLKAALNETQVN